MAKRRIFRWVATLAVLSMLATGLFSGVAAADTGDAGDDSRALQQTTTLSADTICVSRYTLEFRYLVSGNCPGGYTQITISESLPFDYCFSAYTGLMRDDLRNDRCAPGYYYVVIDGTTSFSACINPYTGQLRHTSATGECITGVPIFFVDFRGDITKFVCVEENLNLEGCDYFPAGPHNETRQIGPMVNTSGGFQDIHWQWVFDGNNSPTQRCVDFNDCDNAEIEAALEALPGINDVTVTGGPIAGTVNAPIRIEFVGVDAQTDIIPDISIQPVQSTNPQSDVTIVDGAVNGPEVSYIAPGGTVQIWEATGATDPNDPLTYGDEVTAGPQMVDANGSYAAELLDGDYVICATGTGAVGPSCELVTVFDDEQTIVNNVDLPGTITAEITNDMPVNAVWTIDDDSFGPVSGGMYTITVGVDTTPSLDFDASAGDVQDALEGLTSVGENNVTVTGGPPYGGNSGAPFTITFVGDLAGQNVSDVSVTTTGGGCLFCIYFATQVTQGSSAVHTLTADARVSGGTFTLTFDDGQGTVSETVALDWNATVEEIENALNALPSINGAGGSVTVVSTDPNFINPEDTPITKAPVEVNFSGVEGADTNVLQVDNTNLE